jgi:hypothetical protein
MRYTDDKFQESFYSTVGVDFKITNFLVDDKRIRL